MRNNIKYSASFIIILSLILGFNVYAEENTVTGSGNIQVKVQEKRVELEKILQTIKEKREAFKTKLELNRVETQVKIEKMKVDFKKNIKKIKNEDKKISAEKILDSVQALNIKLTEQLSDRVNQIENVLVSIESRITKAEEKGLDVASVKTEVEKAKEAIASARTVISTQASKVYEVNITDEATLRVEMKKLRDTFQDDIKGVREQVKQAHIAVRNTATTLAKIPTIDAEVEVKTEVENNNITNNN
jgi:hypothetical protein